MKKLLIGIIVTLFLFIPNIKAINVNDKGFINKDGVLFYSAPNYSGNKVLNTLDTGDIIEILDTNLVASNDSTRCTNGFYKIKFYWESNKKTYEGYVCADKITFSIDTTKYAEEFASSGIPESYWEKLTLLKDNHPNWKFTGYKTNLNWDDAITAESQVGISYIQSSNPIYLSLDEGSYNVSNNTYNQMEAGGWYAANKQTVAYYMDPRNFLNEINIFMFENLGYNSSLQTKEVIESIFAGTDLVQYADYYIQAATYDGNNISPVSLAARSRQELISGDGKISNSANGNGKINGISYYNFYNIGAFSSCSDPIFCALDFAKGYDENYTSYNRPWTDPIKAILEGAKYIADGYINVGQNTLYLQRFNVTNKNTYSHQYMTNTEAPYSESKSSYNAYKKIDKLDSTIEFLIPVYENMPDTPASLPVSVDQNTIDNMKNNSLFTDIISKSGYTDNDQYITNINLGTTAAHMIAAIKSSGGDVIITTDGKNISGQEKLGTGDIATIKANGQEKSYRIVIRGDANGDGEIDAVDYVKIYKYIMGGSSLNGSYSIAADVNNDGTVDAIDYVKLYKYIMNGGTL